MVTRSLQASAAGRRVSEDVDAIELVELLEEDEGEHGVGAEPSIVRREALPQREETLLPDHHPQHVLSQGENRGVSKVSVA